MGISLLDAPTRVALAPERVPANPGADDAAPAVFSSRSERPDPAVAVPTGAAL